MNTTPDSTSTTTIRRRITRLLLSAVLALSIGAGTLTAGGSAGAIGPDHLVPCGNIELGFPPCPTPDDGPQFPGVIPLPDWCWDAEVGLHPCPDDGGPDDGGPDDGGPDENPTPTHTPELLNPAAVATPVAASPTFTG